MSIAGILQLHTAALQKDIYLHLALAGKKLLSIIYMGNLKTLV
jgi:hypothetical protein